MHRMKQSYLVATALTLPAVVLICYLAGLQWGYLFLSVMLLYLEGQRSLSVVMLVTVLVIPLFILPLTPRLATTTYDAELWRLDSVLRVNLQPDAMLYLYHSRVLGWLAKGIYEAYILGLTLAALIGGNPRRFFTKVAVATVLGACVYCIVPACGPFYYMHDLLATAPRNAFPSMHTVWALMMRWHVRSEPLPIRIAADVFLLFVVIATVGFGEHYVIDVIAAVPFWGALEYWYRHDTDTLAEQARSAAAA